MIRLILVKNPLQPSIDREIREIWHEEDRSLEEFLPWEACRIDVEESDVAQEQFDSWAASVAVSLNGHVWPRSVWELVIPRDGDCIVCAPHIAGGSSLWRTLAEVGVAAAAIGASLLTAGLLAPTAVGALWTAIDAGLAAGAVQIGGGLLVGALFNKPAAATNTPSYAFDGPHSLARSGTVIPKGYGTFLWGGNIIASFIDVEGADQYLNVLACYGFGPCRAITGLQINQKDISEYQSVQYYTRLGTNDQLPIPNFNRVVNGYPQDTQCLAGVPVIVPGTGTLTQILQVDIVFPDGVWAITNDNNPIPATLTYLVEYAVSGSGAWQPVMTPATTADVVTYDPITGLPDPYPTWCAVATDLPPNSGVVYDTDNGPHTPGDPYSATQTVTIDNPDGSTSTSSKVVTGEWQLTNLQINQVEVLSWTAGYQSFTGNDHSPLYYRTSIYGLAPGKYDVRITKYGSAWFGHPGQLLPGDNFSTNIGQDMWVHSVNEISLLDLAYPNMILVGVRALATGQLSGSSLDVLALVQHGLRTLDNNILPGALQAFEEDNPACVAADMMLDGLYGGGQSPGVTAANIDRFIDEWVAWAELNDELVDDGNGGSIRRHVFNGVFDNESNLWDQVNAVGRMSRAQLIPLGRDYGVFIDQPDDPCQIFTVGNIVQDSFNETWMAIDDRANQVEISFADSTRYYRTDNPLAYMDPANQDAGVPIKNTRIDGKGITTPAAAWHMARFKERCNQFLLRNGSFKCDVDAIASRPGNVAILQHDVPQWGWGGRTLPGSTTTSVLVDRIDLPFVGGTSYSLIVLHAALQRYTGTVTSVATITDVTGAVTGVQLNLSSFDNANRVTRCVVVVSGVTYDSPITATAAGQVIIQPVVGYTPASSQTYILYDTDVMETCTVSGITVVSGVQEVALGTPLSQTPQDFSTYFYGPVGTQKLIRIANIRKASEFRATVEWIDYDADVYTDATPVVGSTTATIPSNPGVTSLVGTETLSLVNGSYIPYASLSWQLGPDTVGVSIYSILSGSTLTTNPGLPQMVARLTNFPTSFQQQIPVGVGITYIVVGFDVNNDYAGFNSAPRVTINAAGSVTNLIQNSNFAAGFASWTATPRAGDTFLQSTANGGEALYGANTTALIAPITLLTQVIDPSKWTIGQYLMLSAYFQDTTLATANAGTVETLLSFYNAAGTLISSVTASTTMPCASITRVNTAATVIPALTVAIVVSVQLAGGSLNLRVGSSIAAATLLLEIVPSSQTTPDAWAFSAVGAQINTYAISPLNPLTQPTSTTIALAAVTAVFGGLTLSYSARTFTIPTPSGATWYYVTIADAAEAGETAPILPATCQTSAALVGVQGNTYMGAIQALPAGGATDILAGGNPAPATFTVHAI